MREYMYVFIRGDLNIPQQIVQASHACANIGETYHSDTNIVLIKCRNEEELLKVSCKLDLESIDYSLFHEPDINAHTALATKPISGEQRKVFRKFNVYPA